MKIVNIVGARPQFIKYFPVSKAIDTFNKNSDMTITDVLIHTGQHYDYAMSKIFFDEFGVKGPDYHLNVGSGSHGEQTGEIIKKVEEVLLKEKPEIIMVYGDTNSTLGGSLAAAKLHIPIAHIESGLRSYNKKMPEEINRILTDHVSSVLFCPSKNAVSNLRQEGFTNVINDGELSEHIRKNSSLLGSDISSPFVINVGDVMYDVLIFAITIAAKQSNILHTLKIDEKDFHLLTLHRAENTDDLKSLEEIIDFVNNRSRSRTVIFPMHPRTKKIYEKAGKKFGNNVRIIEPLGYFDMLLLLKHSKLLMTDSGGMQKEAYWLKVPCITLRKETEWIETVESGWNVLYKDYEGIPFSSQQQKLFYGDGKAAEKIVTIISEIIGGPKRDA
jgi:UDP-GlcNAc3NAcA epimerase